VILLFTHTSHTDRVSIDTLPADQGFYK